ncbi:elongation of very long chain fatty acids protein 4-like [Ruditapes philippinarum]|uniref:elongation of very long chain fatty acids protein 4-like n=1 Tax=Ruditapes philippinarum TaxID=129788 RepID=UPI00295A5F77|nr:elongation of very long chain fatty acids protein 4-like [Ruditapes philippinarum]
MTFSDYVNDLYAKAIVKDDRTQDWLLVSSIWPTLAITTTYLAVILGGQRVMRNRQPFQLNNLMMFYNFCLVLLNGYIYFEFVMTTWLNWDFSKVCMPVEHGKASADRLAAACWWFTFSKSIELIDTVFFMLRKKNNQITFLHLYHHFTMPLIWYVGVKYVPGGESYYSASINSGIHVLMYTYYLLSAMGPHMQKYLWWKRYMTVMQLIQFWAILFHTSYAIYSDCGYPNLYNWALIFYDFTHIALFSNFYYQTYSKKAKEARLKKMEQNGTSRKNGLVHEPSEGKMRLRSRKD